jgi:hypothetical protein
VYMLISSVRRLRTRWLCSFFTSSCSSFSIHLTNQERTLESRPALPVVHSSRHVTTPT